MFKRTALTIWLCLVIIGWRAQLGAAEDKTVSLELKSTPDGQLFYVEVKVGEGHSSNKSFNLLVSTASPITWLPSGCRVDNSSCDGHQRLERSGTGYGGHDYAIQSAPIDFGSQLTMEQSFAAVLDSPPNRENFPPQWRVNGVLGLALDHRPKMVQVQHLLENLNSHSHINKSEFSLYINKSAAANLDDQQEPKGALILGGMDANYHTGNIHYARLHQVRARDDFSPTDKTLMIDSIHLDWSRVGQDKETTMTLHQSLRTGRILLNSPPTKLLLDSTSKLFVGDQRILDKIHLNFLGAKTVVKEGGVYVFKDCRLDNKPDFVFTLDGVELRITPQDYVVHGQIVHAKVCFSAFKAPTARSHPPIWVFGTRFLRNYYTVFDFENNVVGFATAK